MFNYELDYKKLETFENYHEFKIYLDMCNMTVDFYAKTYCISTFTYHNDGHLKNYIGYLIPIKNRVFPITHRGDIINLKNCDVIDMFRILGGYGSDTIDTVPKSVFDFNIMGCKFKKLPTGIKMVIQDYDCSCNQLTSLEGSPTRIGGSFICRDNKLTTLVGAPRIVNRDFNCSANELTSLEGAPRIIGGEFSCGNNFKLSSLRGAPSYILGTFDTRYMQSKHH